MFVGANKLNIRVKSFINYITANSENRHPDDRQSFQDYSLFIDEYIEDISEYNFSPRSYNLTEDNILRTLENTKVRINGLLATIGGRRRKSIRRKTSRKGRSRKAYRK